MATVEERETQILSRAQEGLSANSLANALGIPESEIQIGEKAGKLFSFVRPQRGPEREYPAFQAWPGITGEPLRRVLAALEYPPGPTAYGFFSSPTDTLAGLSPLELLLGISGRSAIDSAACELLNRSVADRIAIVIDAARHFTNLLKSQ